MMRMSKQSIEDFSKVIDGLEFRADSMHSPAYLVACIKNYKSLCDVKFPLELGTTVKFDDEGNRIETIQYTHPDFDDDWIMEHVSDDVLMSMWHDVCQGYVGEWVDSLEDALGNQADIAQVGRQGGYLAAIGVTRDSILDYTMRDVIAWADEADRIRHLCEKYNPWTEVAMRVYWNDWEEAEDATEE